MMERRWALTVPLDGLTLAELPEAAREAERLGYADAWSFEADGADCFTPLAALAVTTGLRLGTAIANVFTRGPATLAMQAAALADLAPGRFCLGVGAGSSVIVEAWNGGRFVKPLTRVREMVQVLRAALAGERVVFRGETLQVDGFRLTRLPPAPVPIHVAALRPGMLRLAGEVADGVILNWLSAEDVPRSVAVVREAAAKAGRDPSRVEISARLFAHVDPPGPAADTVARRHITAYLNVPVYRAFHEWLGRTQALGPMWAAWERGDRKAALAAVPDRVVDDLLLRGAPEAIRAGIRRYLDAGLDTAFVTILTAEPEPVKKREIVLGAMRALAPGRG
jgi:probable F420-dependent oxidoreductase